ncbi:hypothetical protein CFC21_079249 [Triticum aestivum]|uniref:TF-B3 domain-containing protein n=2 Tax=Triticum aestivum TaxID=4565 RepID=A0A9R1L1M8_WHEAT|nr:hypothetical protein CFC21_079249 [Triticum aestivum]
MDMGELFNPGCGGAGGAGCDCGDCEEWRRYCYWNHDHGTKQFLLFASDDKDHLCIPWEVSSQLRDMIPDSEPIKLETPDGRTYSVKFFKFGRITLTTGWRGFVDANHIEENNPMLFVYRGNSTFKVQIFNSSGRDKFLPCSQPPCNHHVLNEQVVPHPGHVDSSAHFGYTMLPGSFVTKAQDDKLLEWANTIKSEFPLFVAAMDESNVSLSDCHVYIPLSLVGQFKEEVVKIVALDKSIYVVGAKKHNEDQIVLQSGWHRFVASQCIQQNDFLIFIIEGEARLKVLVLDPSGSEKTFAMGNSSNAQEKPPLPPTVTNQSSDNELTDLSSDYEVLGKDTTTSRREQRPLRSCRAKAEKMGHKAGNSNEAGIEAPMPNKSYIVPQAGATKLTVQQEEKVKEKVRAIGSEFPVFVKVMTAYDVSKMAHLAFCMEYASACRLPLEQTPLLLRLEGSNMRWSSALMIQQNNNVRRICSFWQDIVSQAGTKEGDILLVELAGRSSRRLRMTVHLIRKSECSSSSCSQASS